MLKNLHIENYALIESLDIDFLSGFSVITGETGAGKSIILGALGLILGNRADSTVVSNGAKRCVAEATFDIAGLGLASFFEENELDYDEEECIIRRELTAAGKSRAFINDTPVQLSVLRTLSGSLIDIHSQHNNLLLSNSSFQMNVLDSIAQNESLLAKYATLYTQYATEQRQLQELEQSIRTEQANVDFLQFQYQEISALNLSEGEQEELEEEQLFLDNAENIKQALYDASTALSNITENLGNSIRTLSRISEVYPDAADFVERLDSCKIELDDIEQELTSRQAATSFDATRYDFVNERLSSIYSLQKKYHKESLAELLALQNSLAAKLKNITGGDELLNEKREHCAQLRKQAVAQAQLLTASRQKAAAMVEKSLVKSLRLLGIPDVSFKVEVLPIATLKANGMDDTAFLFSSNKNSPLKDITKIASGGEISRVMLSLKVLLSSHRQLPTIIFDEIDTGVSGKIADEMANAMNAIGQCGRQVISITHLPQIAARGQQHYRVFKTKQNSFTYTKIERLTPEMRINEIAQMLSGSTLTEAAISNAKTLLNL